MEKDNTILWGVSYIGTGHLYRNIVIARKLIQAMPEIKPIFLSAGDIPALIRREGFECIPCLTWDPMTARNGWLDLRNFLRAWISKEELNKKIYDEMIERFKPALIISDELPSFLEVAQRKGLPSIYLTDFLSFSPTRFRLRSLPFSIGFRILRPYINNSLRRSYEKASAIVYLDDASALDPDWRSWALQHVRATGPVLREPPRTCHDVKKELGIGEEEKLITTTVGGSDLGLFLLETVAKAYPLIIKECPGAKMLMITGPAIDPQTLWDRFKGMAIKIKGFEPEIIRYLQASDLVICLSGHSTLQELAAYSPAKVITCPIGDHWEQEKNAAMAEKKGLARVIYREELNPYNLARIAIRLLTTPEHQPAATLKSAAIENQAYIASPGMRIVPPPAEVIVQLIMKLIKCRLP